MKTCNRFHLRVEELEGRLVPSTLSYSTNWSGYAVSTGAGAVSRVAGSWVVPAVATTVSGYSSAWVGIDGWSSSTVEQIGTDSDYINGRAQYYAWYEMYPAGSVTLSLSIHPGDTIQASVSNTSPGQFALSITNVNTGASYSTTKTSSTAQRSSAEWIQEAPSSFTGVLPLANFSTVKFSGASATVNGSTGPADTPSSGSSLNQVNMVTSAGSPKATTSALTDSGSPATSSFSVTFVSSGSGTKGHAHKSSDLPPTTTTTTTGQINALASAALTNAGAGTQGPLPAFAAVQSAPSSVAPAVASPAAIPLAGLSELSTASGTAGVFGSDAASADGQAPVPATAPQPPPNGRIVPADSGAAAQPDGPPVSPAVPAAPPEQGGQAVDAGGVDGVWSTAPFEGAVHGVPASPGGALAGLILTLAVDRRWPSLPGGRSGERARERGRPVRAGDDR
jgi:hypothetical protein